MWPDQCNLLLSHVVAVKVSVLALCLACSKHGVIFYLSELLYSHSKNLSYEYSIKYGHSQFQIKNHNNVTLHSELLFNLSQLIDSFSQPTLQMNLYFLFVIYLIWKNNYFIDVFN